MNVAVWTIWADFSWYGVLAVQSPLTALLIIRECRSLRYHGIFSKYEPM